MKATFLKGVILGAVVSTVTLACTVAFAGTGIGSVFNLGQVNRVDARTALGGSTNSAQLQVTNNSTGAAAAGIGINTTTGKPPLVVNSSTKVNNLNADRLDGHDSSFFTTPGFSTGFTDSNPVVLEANGTSHQLMSLSVPPGHYSVITRLQGITGGDGGGNSFRYDCRLAGPAGTIDDPTYRVGEVNGQENYLTYEGGYVGQGPITFVCRSANVHTLTALSGRMVAIKVGT